MEQYQDIWVKGKLEKKGVRECEKRYQVIKKVLDKFERSFTVLDMGANLGYFSFRIAEDYPMSSVVMIESPNFYGKQLQNLAVRNDLNNIILLQTHMDLYKIKVLSEIEHFDVVLAMSVVHHIDGDPNDVVNEMSALGDRLIIELPNTTNACNPHKVVKINPDLFYGKVEQIGEGDSHVTKGGKRPIYMITTIKNGMKKRYYNCPPHLRSKVGIESSWKHKHYHHQDGRKRVWIKGINLYTFMVFNGTFPYVANIEKLLRDLKYEHATDIRPWNFIIAGRGLAMIDANDKVSVMNVDENDFDKVITWLNGGKVTFKNCGFEVNGKTRI